MLPTKAQLRVDKYLTDYAIGYSVDRSAHYAAAKIGTVKTVNKSSDYYPIWSKGSWFRSEMQEVGRNVSSPVADPELSNDTYKCREYRLKTFISAKDAADSEIDLGMGKTEFLVDQALLKRDITVAAAVFATGLWVSVTEQTGVSSSPSTNEFLQWDASSSTPIANIHAAKEKVRASCGMSANVMVTSQPVINALLTNSDILARYQYTQGGSVQLSDLEKLFGLKIVVGMAMQNTAKEGATASLSDVWGKHALFLYVDPNPSPAAMRPTAVTVFSWSEYDKMTADGATIRRWDVQDPQGEYIEVEAAYDAKITANDAGVFYASAVA